MPSERVQRQIDRLFDQAEEAIERGAWELVRSRAEAVLRLDPGNQDALTYLTAGGGSAPNPPGQRTGGRAPLIGEGEPSERVSLGPRAGESPTNPPASATAAIA